MPFSTSWRGHKFVNNCWTIIGKELFLRTGLSVIENYRNFKTHFFVLVRYEDVSDKLLFFSQ